jgi:general stress protein 26
VHTTDELQQKFWDSLGSDRTVMLGREEERGTLRPMTAQIEDGQAPIWFFTTKDNELVSGLGSRNRGLLTYASKGHDLFATVHGILTLDTDRYTVDRLWSPFVAAWYEGGRGDPNLALLRFEPDDAQIWLNESGLLAGVKMLLGADPKKDLAGNVAKVQLS